MMDDTSTFTSKVVAIADYRPDPGFSAISQVEAYWEALRKGDALPKRSQIDPRGIEQALQFTFVVEDVARGAGRLRIAGAHLNDLMGMEVRGMPLTALFTPPARRVLCAVMDEVFQTPAVAHLVLSSAPAPQRSLLEARMVLLPLQDELGATTRMLGCLVSNGALGTAPRRFDVTAKQLRRLLMPQGHIPDMVPTPEPHPARPHGFSEPAGSFEEPRQNRPGKPFLYLVKSDD